jgi:Ca-activated chloride channel family protein
MALEFDPYGVLGVSNTAGAEEIKAAYRRLARRLHPDVNSNPGAGVQFQDVTAAYEVLLDPIRRKMVDDEMLRRASVDDFYFTLRVTPSKRSITPLPEPQVLYLLAEIFPDPRAQDSSSKRETRLNLTLVLDHSNSMAGVRLEKVKIAAYQIIDNLSPDDILSVVTFNDRADVIIPATTVRDKPALKARVSMMLASGGTEIFHGLSKGVEQNRQFLGPKLVNHVILLTDGHTFGDQDKCIDLAVKATKDGISISAMGLGNDWNDKFLDELASRTGGNSLFISSANSVVKFLNEQVRNLTNAFADRVKLAIAPDPDVQLELAFKLAPHPQPLEIGGSTIPLGNLQANRHIAILLQVQLPGGMDIGFRSIVRLVASGDILQQMPQQKFQTASDLNLEVTTDPSREDPPSVIMDALSKLTLYRLQEKAQEALERGDVAEATRRLENLATRLLAIGQEDLANEALAEARRVAHTADLSDKGRKTLKYQTRHLLLPAVEERPE